MTSLQALENPNVSLNDAIFSTWRRYLVAADIDPENLFTTIAITDRAQSPGNTEPAWWPRKEFDVRFVGMQEYCLHDGSMQPFLPKPGDNLIKGEKVLLQRLFKARGDARLTAAILINGSLYSRGEESQTLIDKRLGASDDTAVSQVIEFARETLEAAGMEFAHQEPYTRMLPYIHNFENKWTDETDTLEVLVERLAYEHVMCLREYQLLLIEYADEPDAELVDKHPYLIDMFLIQQERQGQKSHATVGSDEARDELLEKLNALLGEEQCPRVTVASKAYVDIFGEPIHPGDEYYLRNDSGRRDGRMRVAKHSMNGLLHFLFHDSDRLEYLVETLRRGDEVIVDSWEDERDG